MVELPAPLSFPCLTRGEWYAPPCADAELARARSGAGERLTLCGRGTRGRAWPGPRSLGDLDFQIITEFLLGTLTPCLVP